MAQPAPRYKNLVELYQKSVEKYFDRPLFGTKQAGQWRWMTYRELGDQVDRIRGGLAAIGVGKGDRVAIIANNRPEWAIAAYATYGLGASFVPMYEAQQDKEWKYILVDCGAKAVFVADDAIRDRILPMNLGQVITIAGSKKEGSLTWQELLERGKSRPTPAIQPQPSEIAGFIYTSGTTGNPKGVLLSHANIASNVSAMHEIFPMSPEDRSLSFLPWAHSFGQVVELHMLLSMGASMGIAESIEKIVDNLAEVQPTLLFSVPRIFNRIYDGLQKRIAQEKGVSRKLMVAAFANATQRRRLAEQGKSSGFLDLQHRAFDRLVFAKVRKRFGGRLKYAFSGGAAISKEVAEFIDNLGILVYEGYGLTETSPIATANWPGARKIGSVGKAIPGVRIEIDRAATGDAKQGEIIVHGHNVMQGYHQLPEEDAKVFTPDRGFRTGDMGHLDDEGFLYITGRIKEQYKLENGKYVAPSPLEEKLTLSPLITSVMIYGDNKPYNVALIVPDFAALERWARDAGIDVRDREKLCDDPRVKALYEQEVEKYSGEFKQFEKVRKVCLATEEFTLQNEMLTPSLKVKRRVVMARWGEKLDRLYA
jgi:long-chain acyl-CoA synthetase